MRKDSSEQDIPQRAFYFEYTEEFPLLLTFLNYEASMLRGHPLAEILFSCGKIKFARGGDWVEKRPLR